MKKIMDGNEACSYVAYNFTEVAGIYPITPASPMAEVVDKWSNEGKKNYFNQPVKVVEMESEAGAAGMVHGSLQAGCLTTTFTASQGLLLMIPNMYKIAGELLPCVIHVAARSLATHALSIFGDHQDIYAARSTGFAFLAESSPQQVMDLTAISHLAAIKGRVPFLNFFDGFRTSHELQKVEVIDTDKVKRLVDKKALAEFRERSLHPSHPVTRGTSENDDIYFQATEVRNKYYDALPDIVNDYMQEINKLTGKNYAPFNYYGAANATKVIIAMGSVSETIKETVDYLVAKGEKVGFVEVHLYRPFSSKYFLKSIPKTVENIAVLDRTKEPGSSGEPLYLDVASIIKDVNKKISVVGGRYGLSSKNTTPSMIKAIYDNMGSLRHNFTIGIEDDVTNLSIPYDKNFNLIIPNQTSFKVFGYGSDGMVSACKDFMKITGDATDAYVQGYFQYDSKKSGGVTISHLRFSKNEIKSTYYVDKAKVVVCTEDAYLKKFDVLSSIEKNGTFILNTTKTKDEINSLFSKEMVNYLKSNNIKLYIVDANKISGNLGLGNKISAIMENLMFKYGHVIDYNYASNKMKEKLVERFKNKGNNLAEKNIKALEEAANSCLFVDEISGESYAKVDDIADTFFKIIDKRKGNDLPVSAFLNRPDGTMEAGLSKLEKRDISETVPLYNKDNCINCNLCSLVCPHAVIRPFLLTEEEKEKAPEEIQKRLTKTGLGNGYYYTVGVSYKDCTGCGLCANICPGKKKIKALEMIAKKKLIKEELTANEYLFNNITEKTPLPLTTVKGTQFKHPKFEFSGACAGCGETPYLKLITQLFGDRLVIANATGCSSIYGASSPSTPYSIPWANSLFEDNAEFGMGIKIADEVKKNQLKQIIRENIAKVDEEEKEIYEAYLEDINMDTATKLLEIIPHTKIKPLKSLKKYITPISLWTVGGDGWAYDIGYNGIDHLLASAENINILVLDTEVYSNTGGQASKSSRVGAVCKFASNGKKTAKKDLAKIALTYKNVYVACISLGASPQTTIKVLNEAEKYNGPSLIIAYSPCIAQGILRGMKNSIMEEKNATETGYFPIFHYNPEAGEFKMDSKADFSNYKEFLLGEDRYKSLANLNSNANQLLEENLANAKERYTTYKEMESKSDN